MCTPPRPHRHSRDSPSALPSSASSHPIAARPSLHPRLLCIFLSPQTGVCFPKPDINGLLQCTVCGVWPSLSTECSRSLLGCSPSVSLPRGNPRLDGPPCVYPCPGWSWSCAWFQVGALASHAAASFLKVIACACSHLSWVNSTRGWRDGVVWRVLSPEQGFIACTL